MRKVLVFDMDNTIALLYDVKGWLEDLHNSNPRPYIVAEPKVDMEILNRELMILKNLGFRIVVTSWLAKNSTKEYDKEVRQAKIDWLEKYSFPYDEIHLVKYGTPKQNCTRKLGGLQILLDDNEDIRKSWNNLDKNRYSIDAENENIIEKLYEMILEYTE